VILEDHHPEGGIGEAVLAALAAARTAASVEHLAVRAMPSSGSPDALVREAGIAASDAVAAVHRLMTGPEGRS
jgi:transketolase